MKIALVLNINIKVQDEETRIEWMDLETREVKTKWYTFNGYEDFDFAMDMFRWDLENQGYEIKF